MKILNALIFLSLFLFSIPSNSSTSRFQQNQRGDRELVDFAQGAQLVREHELDRSNFYDPDSDYSNFEGRVTDRDRSSSILKVFTEENNIKFFRAGDPVRFQVQRRSRGECRGHVRDIEPNYVTIFVKDLYPCWQQDNDYFRRGTSLLLNSSRLEERVKEASRYRHSLLKRREDFFNQLNNVNHFLWSFQQQRVILSAEYDKKIEELKRQKQEALNSLTTKKVDQSRIQRELISRLDELDRDLEFYRVETKHEDNRWSKDQNTGLPVQKRPQEMRRGSETQSRFERAID